MSSFKFNFSSVKIFDPFCKCQQINIFVISFSIFFYSLNVYYINMEFSIDKHGNVILHNHSWSHLKDKFIVK